MNNIMNKKMAFALGLVSLLACSQEGIQVDEPTPNLVKKTFNARTVGTKTELGTDGRAVLWSTDDQINIFDETASCASYSPFTVSQAGASASFEGYVDESATEFYALYPYDADATWDASTLTLTTSLSHKQTGVEGGFENNTNLAVAKADGANMSFHNLCVLLRLTVSSSDITEIVLKANNSEKLAGDVTVVFDEDGNADIDEDATGVSWSKVQLLPESGSSTFTPGTYNIVVLPFGLKDGLTVNVTKTDDKVYSKAKKLAATGSAGYLFELGTIDSGLSYDRDKLSLTDPRAMTLLYTAAQKNAIASATGTSIVSARSLTNTRGKVLIGYSSAVSDETKATTDPEAFYDNAKNEALLTLNAFMAGQWGSGSDRKTMYGSYATPLLADWAEACVNVDYSNKELAGPMLARVCFPWFVYYQYAKLSDNFSTAAQRSTIEAWFRKIVEDIKTSQALWQANDYYEQQYYSNHLAACCWGLVSAGYALGDMSLVEYAIDSIDNPRDFYDLLQGCILIAGDTPCPRDPNTVADRTGEIIERYRHSTAGNKGLQYTSLTLQILSTIARSMKNVGLDLYTYTCPTGENLELAYTFYAPFYASNPPDASLQGGYYTGEDERIGLAGDLHGLFELGYNAYSSNTAIQAVISAIPNRASNGKASSATYPNNANIMQMHQQLGYTRMLSVDVDTTL